MKIFSKKAMKVSHRPFLLLCYIHIYKCGGSSMRRYIREHLLTTEITLVDQWAYEWERTIKPANKLLGNFTRAEYLRNLSATKDSQESIVILTHSFFYEFMKNWPAFSFATMLRDPVNRIISQFFFQKREFSFFTDSKFIKWLDSISSYEFNLQTAALSSSPNLKLARSDLENAKANLHFFDFIGLVDEYETSLKLFNRIYGINSNSTPPKLNVNPETPDVPAEVLKQIRERCTYDIELLEYAQILFKAKQAAFEMIDAGDPSIPPKSIT